MIMSGSGSFRSISSEDTAAGLGERRVRGHAQCFLLEVPPLSPPAPAQMGDLISHQQTSETKAGYQQPVGTAERAEV